MRFTGAPARLAIASLAFGLIMAACGGGGGGSKGTVNIAVNPWVGYTADAAVVKYVLEKKMGYTVNLKDLKEDVSWAAFESGQVDAILEDWGHPEFEKIYITDKKVAMSAGSTGNIGIIGWYIPTWMVDKYPDIVDYKNLNKYADLFKTSETGDLGQFLGTDPSYIQYDEALVKTLGLDFKVIFTGSENATVAALKQAVAQEKPIIAYWWDPHWLNAQVKLTRIALPPYTAGCADDKEKVACDYPETDLKKVIRVKFNEALPDAAKMIMNFKWTNADQNAVANDITNNGMTSEEAAKKWVDANEAVWKTWIPS